jgi:hypothetical protein
MISYVCYARGADVQALLVLDEQIKDLIIQFSGKRINIAPVVKTRTYSFSTNCQTRFQKFRDVAI